MTSDRVVRQKHLQIVSQQEKNDSILDHILFSVTNVMEHKYCMCDLDVNEQIKQSFYFQSTNTC
jgi:hypothetical protein